MMPGMFKIIGQTFVVLKLIHFNWGKADQCVLKAVTCVSKIYKINLILYALIIYYRELERILNLA